MNDVHLLEDALDRMANALQKGAIGDLGGLARDIEAASQPLPPMTALQAEGVRRRAARNDACLQAAAKGVRAAIAHVTALSAEGFRLSTYGADGRKTMVGAAAARHSARL